MTATSQDMLNAREVSEAMQAAYVAWEPPVEMDTSRPARVFGLLRAAFFGGWFATLQDTRIIQVERERDEALATLKMMNEEAALEDEEKLQLEQECQALELRATTAEAHLARAREALSRAIGLLTNHGRNTDHMLSIDHDALAAWIKQTRTTLTEISKS